MWFLNNKIWYETPPQIPLCFEVGTRAYLWGSLMGGGI